MKVIVVFLCVLAAPGLFGQTPETETALVREFTGTVEVKVPGQGEWEPVRRGQRLPGDTLISTGFRSQALLDLGNSTLTVRSLTRLSITELFRAENSENVKLNLRTGRVKADVKPPAGGRIDFSVRSPGVTASVRGTVFEFDTLNLSVSEGTVEFLGASGAPVLVDGGGSSFADESTGRPAPPLEVAAAELTPDLPPGAEMVIPVNEDPPERRDTSEVTVGLAF
jgi:hypothetical protein